MLHERHQQMHWGNWQIWEHHIFKDWPHHRILSTPHTPTGLALHCLYCAWTRTIPVGNHSPGTSLSSGQLPTSEGNCGPWLPQCLQPHWWAPTTFLFAPGASGGAEPAPMTTNPTSNKKLISPNVSSGEMKCLISASASLRPGYYRWLPMYINFASS